MAVRNPHQRTSTRIGILVIAGFFLSGFIVGLVSATPPPPEYRAGYMLPQLDYINSSIRNDFTVTKEPVPEFPDLSPYHAYQNILYKKTGEHYVSEVWYFTDVSEFSNQSAHIKTYLASHGELSNTTLDLLPELTQFSVNPGTAEYYRKQMDYYPVQNIPAVEYRSNITSGYLVILPNHYYIAYYGRAGPFHPDDNSSIQNVLMMTAVPGYLVGEFGHPFPPSGSGISWWTLLLSPFLWLKIISLILIGILVFRYIMPRLEKS